MRLESYEHVIRDLLHALGKGARALDLDAVRLALEGIHPADLAQILDELTLPESVVVFECLDDERAHEALAKVSQETSRYLIEHSPRERIVRLLGQMDMDDAAEVVAEAGEEAEPLLDDLEGADGDDVQALLSYPEQTAGRLMTGRFAVVQPYTSAGLAIQYLRQNAPALETVNVIYVADGGGKLLGVCSIRDLIVAREQAPVRSIMSAEPITVAPETDQQEVARLISQYDLLAIPVVNPFGRIIGIVTVDDVIDVLVEEFEEDIAKLVGTDADEMEKRTPRQIARIRLPWLLGTMGIELLAGLLISRYDQLLTQVILLASFMPVISATSGSVGLQAATIAVRGLDTGHVTLENWKRALGRELRAAFLIAATCACTLGIIGGLWSRHATFGLVVGLAMLTSMMTAGTLGTLIPLVSKRCGFDPAASAGPSGTAIQDLIGFGVFLWLASTFSQWLR